MKLLKRAGAAALVAATVALGASAASAAPAPKAANPVVSTNSDLAKVKDRRHHGDWNRGRHHRHRHNGFNDVAPFIGLGIAGAILEGALSDDGYGYDAPGYSGGSGAMQRCAAQFRSFEWDTGLYTTYGGEKRLCPYLG